MMKRLSVIVIIALICGVIAVDAQERLNGSTVMPDMEMTPVSETLTPKIAFIRGMEQSPNGGIHVMNTDGTEQTNLMPTGNSSGGDGQFPAWSPDGAKIAFRGGGTESWRVWVMNADGSDSKPISTSSYPYHDFNPTWSPDGTKIAFSRAGQIWVMNADGTDQTNLNTPFDLNANEPDWSPSGTKIAFTGYPHENHHLPEIMVMDSDGTNIVSLTNDSRFSAMPNWSPDGSKIAFAHHEASVDAYRIHTINPDGSGRTSVTEGRFDIEPDWSPDGSKIVFVSEYQIGGPNISVVNADGTGRRVIAENGDQPAWQPILGPKLPRYVALGDSVSYGHGLANPSQSERPCNDPNESDCILPPGQGPSDQAFPSLLADKLGYQFDLRKTGCKVEGDQLAISGAFSTFRNAYALKKDGSPNYSKITSHDSDCDKSKPHKSIQPEEIVTDRLTADSPNLITLLAGANDIRFGDCFLGELKRFGFRPTAWSAEVFTEADPKDCTTGENLKDFEARIEIFKTALQQILHHIHQDAPQAKVILLTYYQPIPPPGATLTSENALCNALSYTGMTRGGAKKQEAKRREFWEHARKINRMLNRAIRNVASRNSWVRLVDLASVFSGHELCTKNPFVFSLSNASFPPCCGEEWWRVIHPNEKGHETIASKIVGFCTKRSIGC